MYSTCLHCTRDLGRNDVLETLPIGRRIAFDAAQGRLWVVCRSCAKWNLVPFDTRLESIDDCERVFRDTRTRFSTDNIGLARARDGMDLVRIGAPQRPEFASWRYGAQYKRRRRKNVAIATVGFGGAAVIPAVASSLLHVETGPLAVVAGFVPGVATLALQAISARRKTVRAVLPGAIEATTLGVQASEGMHLSQADGELTIAFHANVVDALKKRITTVTGADARLLTRRLLAPLNGRVGSSRHVERAAERLGNERMIDWLARLERDAVPFMSLPYGERFRHVFLKTDRTARTKGFDTGVRLGALPGADRLAVEMWLSEEDEATALAGELKLLERQWREAEQLAKIADALGAVR